jgi:hypothetical protein
MQTEGEYKLKASGFRLIMEFMVGLKASIRERKEETTPRQEAIPENKALWTPSMVASLASNSKVISELSAARERK